MSVYEFDISLGVRNDISFLKEIKATGTAEQLEKCSSGRLFHVSLGISGKSVAANCPLALKEQ